ncbi:HNH endonuclease [Priestia megaterium]|uniref:HNH endonuclease n=1 Tax=Priestia TaxID=2800373 RepID=UPI00196B76A4|nr:MULTISPECIES: HNH endonuclease [Priestia]MED3821996.1 HNH endonuclease [Priestia aryabhattai]QSF34709.1 HNH endonuclease [Priestia megaterium]
MQKRCSNCKEFKSATEFHKNKTKKDGLETYCKKCSSERKKKRNRNGGNFTQKQKEKAFMQYGYFCQICGNSNKGELQVDHLMPQIICKPNTASVQENAWVLCASCNIKKGKRMIIDLIEKVPKKVLGNMLIKEYAQAIVQQLFKKVPVTINGKQFTEVQVHLK